MFRATTKSRTNLITCNGRFATRGLTLVEMLISMAVTLVMMAAVVNLFANIGAGVRNRRASMELGSQLRLARARLFKDLAGATSAARPKLPSDDHDDGYLEIVEGLWSDKNPSGLVDGNPTNEELDYSVSIVPSGGDPQVVIDANSADAFVRAANPNDVTNGGGLGDYDDILALTVRSESEPFVGQRTVLRAGGTAANPADWIQETVESDLAEVIWFSVETPAGATTGEPGLRTVYRRTLLIAPWIDSIDLTAIATTGGTPIDADDANRFYQRNDISARYDATTQTWIPNTLSDLTKRENRFAHFFNPATAIQGFPHALRLNKLRVFPSIDTTPLHPFGEPFISIDPAFDDPDRQGEDVMLNDVLAFDLRVFDPGAPLFEYQGVIVEPSSDDVFGLAVAANSLSGYGAFVDLGWDNNYDYPANPNSPERLFQEEREVGWHPRDPGSQRGNPATYDTWPYHYEDDGIDQDGDGVDLDNADGDNDPKTGLDIGLDEGTDGLDNDNDNGVDDALERETSPPYDHPLRGMQVKIRVYDRDSRQIREATVTRNFVPQ